MDFDATLLARIQFAFTVAFHIIFPSFTIGLAAFIATLLVRWRLTGEERFHRLARFWTKIFAVSFAMGVVSGLVLSYQFGTNWSKFSIVVGNVMGPLLGYEVLTAFFLEASFLGIMLFGWQRVSPNLHVLSAVLVAIGTSLSAFWILSANSWMHTPCEFVRGAAGAVTEICGHRMEKGVAVPEDWWRIIFNPSFPYRFMHMFTAAYLTTSIVVLAVGARYLMQGRFVEEAKTMMRMGLGMVIVLAPLQAIIGHEHGVNTAEYQPMKLAAMEGHWHSDKPADFLILAWPKSEGDGNVFELPAPIPGLASWVVTGRFDGTFDGLEKVPAAERPPIVPVFYSFRVMVLIGLLLIAIGLVGGFLWLRGRLFETRWFLAPVQHIWPLGFIAILAGWWVTESGRQPWIATGILKTAEAVSPVTFEAVLFTLVLFVLVYSAVFSMGVYYINRLIEKGPKGAAELPPQTGVPSRPLSAAEAATREAIKGAH